MTAVSTRPAGGGGLIDVGQLPLSQRVPVSQRAFAQRVEVRPSVFIDAGDVKEYEGPYDVTPSVAGETLPTRDRLLAEDVEVRGIPYAEVSNESGGLTASIG